MKQWVVTNKRAEFQEIAKKFGIDQVTARIIRNRDIVTDEEIQRFLYGGLDDLEDEYRMKDAQKLVDILIEKIRLHKKIRIIGDYDIDGVMSSYVLWRALCECGARVDVAIPNRITDGYGLNIHLIEDAIEAGVDTILTCDNGIAAIDEIAYAKEHGMTVLVTDHHEIPYEEVDGRRQQLQSQADAIVNPHQQECAYAYKDLCGAAVAFKVICILYDRMQIARTKAYELLEFVAFATVGDVMPLTGENRILVKEGIKRIHHTTNTGMKALIAQCNLTAEQIDCYHFGFVLGPCINAAGRLDTARRALALFQTDDAARAALLANELVVLNEERKQMTMEGVEEAKRMCETSGMTEDAVLVVYLPDVHESVAGIIAGRIREYYGRPAFVLTKGEEGIKGSGRSVEGYSMYEQMCKCNHYFTKFGGHPMAAGLSMQEKNIEPFRREINRNCPLTVEQLQPKIRIDVPMPIDYISQELVEQFSVLAPFGKENPKPVFADRNLAVSRMWIVGKNQNVLRMTFVSQYGTVMSGIYFGDMQAFFTYLKETFGEQEVEKARAGRENAIRLSIVYYPRINRFHNTESLQLEIQYYR